MEINTIITKQKQFFESGATKSLTFRKEALIQLGKAIEVYQERLLEAVKKDFGKSREDTYLSEIWLVKREIKYMLKNLKRLTKVQKVHTSLINFPSRGYRVPEPYGVVCLISPWNYPIQLVLLPLIGAMAAGNCSILKLSELVPHVNHVLMAMFREIFEPEYVVALMGGKEITQEIIAQKVDYIFFTGSPQVGKQIMTQAAQHLIPVTLELGGKSPVIIDDTITNFDIVAKRIVWGKFLNAGQTCVAPDYILINRKQKETLIQALNKHIQQMYYENRVLSDRYTQIINQETLHRLAALLIPDNILIGGKLDLLACKLEPTVVEVKDLAEPLMQEEIFGPILAIVEINSLEDAIHFVNSREKPLALYVFSEDKTNIQYVLEHTSSGGVAINDTISHITEANLPFGGIGNSGMGEYHGKSSFDTFTHFKSVLHKPNGWDIALKYPPYHNNIMKILR